MLRGGGRSNVRSDSTKCLLNAGNCPRSQHVKMGSELEGDEHVEPWLPARVHLRSKLGNMCFWFKNMTLQPTDLKI